MEEAMGLSNVQKKIDNFSQFFFFFLKNGNEINRQEQNTSLNPKKESPGDSAWKRFQNSD